MNNYYDYQREDEENESDEVDGEPSCSEQRSRVSAQRSKSENVVFRIGRCPS